MTQRCILVLGGSFDPVHKGHMALAHLFVDLLTPDELRIIPAGNPWQKQGLQASGEDRIAMAHLAFDHQFTHQGLAVTIDQQEVRRNNASYTIDTLRSLRSELGEQASIVFVMGADQLQQLNTWKEWLHLFDYAHLCAASRPGFSFNTMHLPNVVAEAFQCRQGTTEQIRHTPSGLSYLASGLDVAISATEIRAALQSGKQLDQLLPPEVLDYIYQHHLYQS